MKHRCGIVVLSAADRPKTTGFAGAAAVQWQKKAGARMRSSTPTPEYYDDPAMAQRVRSLRVERARRARVRRRRQRLCRLVLAAAVLLVLGSAALLLWQGTAPALGLPRRDAVPANAAADSALPAEDAAAGVDTGIIVYIDPGHGGIDTGAQGLGFTEAEMTWQTAGEVMDLLSADDRFSPHLTKTQDETCKPGERAAAARAGGAALVLSIHGNSDPVYGSTGFECYPAPPGRGEHEEGLRFARILADKFSAAGAALRGADGVRYLYYDENDNKIVYESYDTTVRDMPGFTLLEEAGCPAVLAEQCFITNEDDVAAFAGEEGCKAAARLYYEAICAYFDLAPKNA